MSGTSLTPAGLGLRAQRGGAVVVGVALERNEPRVLLSAFVATAADGDRLALEPYHVAADLPRGPDGEATPQAAAAVAEGRARQEACAAAGLADIAARLRGLETTPVVAALLVNRAGWITDLLDYSLAFPEHARVAEGLAVRDAVRGALGRVGLGPVEMDETSLLARAAESLQADRNAIDARLKALGTPIGRPWRREQKLACLAAWLALAARD